MGEHARQVAVDIISHASREKKVPHRPLRAMQLASAGDYSGIPLTADELQQIKDEGRVCQGALANLLKIVQSLLTGVPAA